MPLGETALHAATAEQHRDAPFDAGLKALPFLESRTLLVRFALGRFLPLPLRNAYHLDAVALARLQIGLAKKAAIRTVKFWGTTEGFLVALQRRFHPSGTASYYGAVGVGIAADPLIAKTLKPIHVDVETKGEFSYGATVTNLSLTIAQFEPRGDRLAFVGFAPIKPNAAYPVTVDSERFARLFVERMLHSPSGTH